MYNRLKADLSQIHKSTRKPTFKNKIGVNNHFCKNSVLVPMHIRTVSKKKLTNNMKI